MRAVEEYFPDSNITDELEANGDAPGTHDEESATPRGPQTYPLRRLSTGATSLVGSMNGKRPGGYILVIDGLALTGVSCYSYADLLLDLTRVSLFIGSQR
jgi:phospholipid-translocating ATPase